MNQESQVIEEITHAPSEAAFSVCSFCRPWWQPITHIRREPLQTEAHPKLLRRASHNTPGQRRCVGDRGILCSRWCQHRYRVQAETNTQLHLLEKCSIKREKKRKRHFKVSAWQDQVESLSGNIKTPGLPEPRISFLMEAAWKCVKNGSLPLKL